MICNRFSNRFLPIMVYLCVYDHAHQAEFSLGEFDHSRIKGMGEDLIGQVEDGEAAIIVEVGGMSHIIHNLESLLGVFITRSAFELRVYAPNPPPPSPRRPSFEPLDLRTCGITLAHSSSSPIRLENIFPSAMCDFNCTRRQSLICSYLWLSRLLKFGYDTFPCLGTIPSHEATRRRQQSHYLRPSFPIMSPVSLPPLKSPAPP